MKHKLNALLAKTEYLANTWKAAVKDYIKFFKDAQGQFKGQKGTYAPNPGTSDVPSRRSNTLVVTTVDEKLKWLEETFGPYLDAVFTQEATNASGVAKAKLVVGDIDFGELTSLELLRLKSFLEHQDIENMYSSIPVRSENEHWTVTSEEQYKNKQVVYESERQEGKERTTEKEQYVLSDPNLDKLRDGMSYTPQLGTKSVNIELGNWTFQRFSGEWSHRQRAELLRRRSLFLTAVLEALKVANDVDVVDSRLTGSKVFQYLHNGK